MVKLEKIDIAKTQEYLQAIYARRTVLFNYFGQKFEKNDRYIETNDTFILIKPVSNFNRLYIASNNREELIEILTGLQGTNVINFPCKGDIQNIDAIMTESGYEQISIYERYVYNVENLSNDIDTSNITLAELSDEEEIYNLYSGWKDFNPYTDWLPTRTELKEFIENKTVLINRQEDKIAGVRIFSQNEKTNNGRLLFDLSGGGKKLMTAMFEIARKAGIKRCQWWVNSQNARATGFHKKLGATPDGLKDYTYIKYK